MGLRTSPNSSACFPSGWLSRYRHGSRRKTLESYEQNVNTKEKLALALHRNCLIFLGNHPPRYDVIKQN